MRPKALQQQDLSQSMAHQEGYKDRWEQGTHNRTEGPATGPIKAQKEGRQKKTKEKRKRDK